MVILRLAGLASHRWAPLSSNVRPHSPSLGVRPRTERMQVTLVLQSETHTLAQLEASLGTGRLQDHSLGTYRQSGVVRKQSIWMRDWQFTPSSEDDGPYAEDLVTDAIAWLEENSARAGALDALERAKIVCSLDEARCDFTVDPEMASRLSRLGVLLLVECARGGSSASEA